jgi:hypothetical protein
LILHSKPGVQGGHRAGVSADGNCGNKWATTTEGVKMIGILIAIVLAALAYWICVALGLPGIVALIAAVLVLLAGIPSGGFGFGSRFGGRRSY